jgi:Txe/YoeB family toxin of Txe-Axe toxin-antitoxin module
MSAILEQLQFESMTWSRSLEFFKQQNAHLKDRLTEVVDKISDKSFFSIGLESRKSLTMSRT